jgi:hypothetical protein
MNRNLYAFSAFCFLLTCAACTQVEDKMSQNLTFFEEYKEAWENRDIQALRSTFYAEDMTVTTGDEVISGEEFLAFIETSAPLRTSTLHFRQIVVDEDGVAWDGFEKSVVLQDSEHWLAGPQRKGEEWQTRLNVFYKIDEQNFSDIHIYIGDISRVE